VAGAAGEQKPAALFQVQSLKYLRKLQNKELHIIYFPPRMILWIISRIMKWMGNFLLMERSEKYIIFYLKTLKGRHRQRCV
jgi:hypothetical protein